MGRVQPNRSGSPALRSIVLLLLLAVLFPAAAEAQTTFTVNTTNDVDDGTCNATHCSLREAITAANQEIDGATIAFNIPGVGPHTIRPTSNLPLLLGNILLDGTTEPDFAGTPVIELDGTNAGSFAQGVNMGGSGNTVRGLVVNRFSDVGIGIGAGADGNTVEGCYVGTDLTGSVALGNGNIGILIGQASNNTIGGTAAGARNLISGNPEGITVVDLTATGNVILGNYIGTDVTGTTAIPNGVGILISAPGTTVGGTDPGAGNVISGNTGDGVSLGPPNATGNVILGNYIGVDVTGTQPLGNDIGIWVDNVADNAIGGTAAGARNVISGNREGITLWDAGATGNLIQGNYIGTNAAGDAAIPNDVGIPVYSPGNTIGGTEAGAGNLVSGNESNGVNLYGEYATGNTVQGNFVGTDATGTRALGNGDTGIAVILATGNTIGGTAAGAGNTASGNGTAGITLWGPETQNNTVQGNFVGTDASGTMAVGNEESGIAIHEAASDNTIGGTAEGAGNVLSGNTFGILIGHNQSNGNRIQGNLIGTNAAGDASVPNTQTGIVLWGQNTLIGGEEAGAGNVISGNGFAGIDLGEGSSGTIIRGNLIGTDATGAVAMGNDLGIWVNFCADNLIGGTASGAGNVISGNTGANIQITGIDAAGNTVQGNFIGTDVTGTVALENGRPIQIYDAPDNTIGGTEAGAGNLISGNSPGITIEGPTATGNVLQGNYIGVDVTGTAALGNGGAGLRLTNGASNNTIGGAESGAGNIIANSGWHGLALFADAGTGNLIRSNSIFGNAGMGIDLGRDAVTLNDEGDADTGANNLQNYPEVTSVVADGSAAIQASLSSTPSSSFTLEFFSNDECDGTGFGEGQTPLGTASLTTDASGLGNVTAAFYGVTGTVVTATATDADGNTSEFSECAAISTLGVSPSPATQTVTPGQSATYAIIVTAQGGTFEGTVDLACSGNPTGTTCTFDQDQVTLASGQASATMTVTTVAPAHLGPSTRTPSPPGRGPAAPGTLWLAVLLSVLGLASLVARGWAKDEKALVRRRSLSRSIATAALGAGLILALGSCGDDGTKPPSGGTPSGSYDMTVTATWESVEVSTTVTMIVQ
jgi:CSLREA domain-containing protein